ncbi:hypothetical protein EPUS_02292 [Endocarpon pusillum Z07020]|uniref:Large ribosomal subunit protein uL29m n=1 Tax=Endocarpon pusillum (strain Z07020 / HMAS-L-300199) TaxID=1263415 RepID=U1GW96_ENDPU|nr:uncharacterized protein EPUS_02292 [Endocarpon pusillum Z07020]ERF76753.1 hypothetical protein EPUS_02292 [Endocarpon pusillum Z07020]
MDQIPALVNSCASASVYNETNNTSNVMAPSEELPNSASKDQAPTLVKRFASLSVSDDGDTTSTTSEAKSPNLDTLPNELLDKIFEESLELNMTLTSTIIAAKLSRRRRLARSLTLLSFCPSDVANNLNLNPVPICGPLGLSHPLTEDDRRVLQRHVLNGDWLTVNMLKLAVGEIHEAYIQKHWVDAGIETKPSYIRAFEERWLASNGVMERKLELCGVDAFREDVSFVIEDPFVIELNSVEELDSDQYDAFDVLQVVVVSDRLLAPPITDSKLELLYFLWRSQSATARWQMTFSESVMRQAVQHAISTGDPDCTCLLVDIMSHSTPDGSSSSVKVEDFLTAAKYNQARILQTLMEFDSRDFPRTDPSMKRWARAARNKGDGFGAIVLEFMRAQNVQPGRHSFSTFLFRSGYVPYNFPLWNAVLDMTNVLAGATIFNSSTPQPTTTHNLHHGQPLRAQALALRPNGLKIHATRLPRASPPTLPLSHHLQHRIPNLSPPPPPTPLLHHSPPTNPPPQPREEQIARRVRHPAHRATRAPVHVEIRKEFPTRDDHGLWGFFNEKRTAMTAPEDLDAHGRAWTVDELAKKNWNDLWTLWWRCVRERNYLATEANERHRVAAGYGEAESKERVAVVMKTMRRIRNVLRDRQYAYDEAQNIVDTAEFWREEIEANKLETREDDFSSLEGEDSEDLLEQLKEQRPMA